MIQLRTQESELALHPGNFRLPGLEGVAPDDVRFEGVDTSDLPIPKVLNPGSRQTQRFRRSRDPVSNLQAGGTPDCPNYELAQIREHSQGARRAQLFFTFGEKPRARGISGVWKKLPSIWGGLTAEKLPVESKEQQTMGKLTIALFVGLFPCGTFAQGLVEKPHIIEWTQCASAAGKRLAATSRESADVIARAALGSCQRQQLTVEFEERPKLAAELKQIIFDRVIREVVEGRASRR